MPEAFQCLHLSIGASFYIPRGHLEPIALFMNKTVF